MPRIADLTQATSFGVAEFMIIETSAGTRIVTKANALPRRSEIAVLAANEVNVDNDRFLLFDATDGLLKSISMRDSLFGDLNNQSETNDFTLDPNLHNVRPVQCSGTFTTGNIQLNGNLSIAGCNFTIANFSDKNLTVVPSNGVSLRVEGAAASGGLIRIDRMASIVVSNGGGVAIFEGG